MDNKEAIDKLKAYFITQDHDIICYSLAALMVDLHRIYYIKDIPDDEKHNLQMRTQINIAEMQRFLKEGPESEMKNIKINS
jgi:hypothetical protein